jgi:hypothetical protein
MLGIYHDRLVGPAPTFPADMERRITNFLSGDVPEAVAVDGTTDAGVSERALPSPPAFATR